MLTVQATGLPRLEAARMIWSSSAGGVATSSRPSSRPRDRAQTATRIPASAPPTAGSAGADGHPDDDLDALGYVYDDDSDDEVGELEGAWSSAQPAGAAGTTCSSTALVV